MRHSFDGRMTLPPIVSRLAARLAFLASLLFALGSWPSVLLAAMTSPADAVTALADRDESDEDDDDVALHRQGASAVRKAREAARPRTEIRNEPRVPRAVPFVAAQSVTRSPPHPPYRSPFRLLC